MMEQCKENETMRNARTREQMAEVVHKLIEQRQSQMLY